jgi:hypothetical protein
MQGTCLALEWSNATNVSRSLLWALVTLFTGATIIDVFAPSLLLNRGPARPHGRAGNRIAAAEGLFLPGDRRVRDRGLPFRAPIQSNVALL